MLFRTAEICYTALMKNMIELYNADALLPERARKKRALIAMLIVGAAGLCACIVLTALATRRNIRLILPLTIGVSVAAGWILITILHGSFTLSGAQVRHLDVMLNEPRESFSGRFEKTDSVRRMKNGLSVRKVLLTKDGHETVLSVNEQKAALLPDAFTGTAQTVYDFIVAYEVDEDD